MGDDARPGIRVAGSDDLPAWDRFVAGHPEATAYHRSVWQRIVHRVFRRETYYLSAWDGDEISGVLPLVRLKSIAFGDFLVSMPYVNYGGLLADDPATAEALLEECVRLAESLRVDHVELRHTVDRAAFQSRTDKVSMRLDLGDSAEALWSGLGSKLRAQVRRPLREGAGTVDGGAELLDAFYAVFSAKYRDLGVPVYPKRWFGTILEELGDDARLFVVRIGSKPVAASFVIRHRGVLEVPWASSLREADRFSVNMHLYWNMLEYAFALDCGTFDFGRSSAESGTYRFKKQWGAEPVQLYWHYWLKGAGELPQLNLDNARFRLAANIWRRMPVWMANQLGPQIVKNLP